ncbi:MAG: hypothetical protein SWH54_02375 [Thermodesulfobacteriota bacterium]|nr:hypothetical protein [Thermodesulfobacteriota bacterium]
MAFKDLFLPKLAHSNPEVRKKAVQNETNPTVLQQVVDNDKDPGVVETAKSRLEELTVSA